MKIIIPSRGRPGKITTIEHIPNKDIVLVVEPNQYEDYRSCYKDLEIMRLPENNQGIGYARHHAFNRYITEDRLFFMDDDITGFYKRDGKKLIKTTGEEVMLELLALCEKGYACSGVSLRVHNYFSKTDYVINHKLINLQMVNMPLIKQYGINFDAEHILFGDIDFLLQILIKKLQVVISYKYAVETYSYTLDRNKEVSGCLGFKTPENLAAMALKIYTKYGDKYIKLRKDKFGMNFTVKWSEF